MKAKQFDEGKNFTAIGNNTPPCSTPRGSLKIKTFWLKRYEWECEKRLRNAHGVKDSTVTLKRLNRYLLFTQLYLNSK